MPTVSRRHYTIKEIYTPVNGFDNISRSADTHEISGLILRHVFLNTLNNVIHFLMGFSYSQTANGIAWKIKLCNFFHVFNTDVRKNSALIDPKQHLTWIDSIAFLIILIQSLLAPYKPAVCAFCRFLNIFSRRWDFYTFIKCHSDIRTEV